MPEILVENEPWLGLVVLTDLSRSWEGPGYYVLARANEWHSDSKVVTVWRSPNRSDEIVPRSNLRETECRTVLIDEQGFYTCPPIIDELRDEVEEESKKLLDVLANERAAESISYIDDNTSAMYDGEVWVKAEFGDAVAVNGELVYGKRGRKAPRNYELTDRGGHLPSGEEGEFEKEYLIEALLVTLTDKLKRPILPGTVKEILDKIYPKQFIYWTSDSGHSEVWASKRAIRMHEKEEERRERQYREGREREAAARRRLEEEARKKEMMERAIKIKQGGYPTPKDWSPRGRLPWERGY